MVHDRPLSDYFVRMSRNKTVRSVHVSYTFEKLTMPIPSRMIRKLASAPSHSFFKRSKLARASRAFVSRNEWPTFLVHDSRRKSPEKVLVPPISGTDCLIRIHWGRNELS